MNLAWKTALNICLGSAPFRTLGQRSPVLGTFINFLYGLFGPSTTALSSPPVMYHPVVEFPAPAASCLMTDAVGQYCTV